MFSSRSEMVDDPLMHTIAIVEQHNRPVYSYIQNVMEINVKSYYDENVQHTIERIRSAPPSATRFHTYTSLNPDFTIHPIYIDDSRAIPDYLRITFTRFRLSSHMLRVETGRWRRTPREDRLCRCGQGIQNEHHLFECQLVRNITESFSKPCRSPRDFFENTTMDDLKTLDKALAVMSDFQNDTSD